MIDLKWWTPKEHNDIWFIMSLDEPYPDCSDTSKLAAVKRYVHWKYKR